MEKPLALTSDELELIIESIASTGNDRLMVGFNRRFAPMLGELKAKFGSAGLRSGGSALPGQRRAAGLRQLVPERGAGRLALRRRRRPLHRHAQLVGRQHACRGLRRARPRTRRPAGDLAIRERLDRHDHLRHRRQRALPEGNAGRGRGRPQRPARQLPPGGGLGRAQPDQHAIARRPGQGPAAPGRALRGGLPDRFARCLSPSSRW